MVRERRMVRFGWMLYVLIFRERRWVMKKMWVSLLVVMISLGLVVVMGGCGGGNGDDDGEEALPKDSPEYFGDQDPAVFDTMTAMYYVMIPWQITEFVDEISLLDAEPDEVIYDSTQTIQGSIDGTLTIRERREETETSESVSSKDEMEIIFSNYLDDGTTFEGVLAGEGSAYFQEKEEATFPEMFTVDYLTLSYLAHQNYSAFYFSDATDEEERSGWATIEYYRENDGDIYPWSMDFSCDIALADYVLGTYMGAFDAQAHLAWGGSYTTYSGQATFCLEDDPAYPIDGCMDVTFDFRWLGNGDGQPVYDYPYDGTAEYSNTLGASVMFEFGSSASNPSCLLLSLDADGDGSYAGTDDWDQMEICEPWLSNNGV